MSAFCLFPCYVDLENGFFLSSLSLRVLNRSPYIESVCMYAINSKTIVRILEWFSLIDGDLLGRFKAIIHYGFV